MAQNVQTITRTNTNVVESIKRELQAAYVGIDSDASILPNKRAAAKAELVKSIKADKDLMAALGGWLPGTVTATSTARTLVASMAAKLRAAS